MDSLPESGPAFPITWGIDRARMRERLARSEASTSSLRGDVTRWTADRREEQEFRPFARHLTVLEAVLVRALDRILDEHVEPVAGTGEGYERCRRLDRCTAVVRAVFQWYEGKYDQRRKGQPDADVLRAADKITLSCWQEPFVRSFRTTPTGPLCFVDNRSDGHVLRRCSVPSELKTSDDVLVADLIEELPVPVIALPETVTREAWWLTVAAHETGHHVEHDLGLAEQIRDALAAVMPADLWKEWKIWRGEVFADAYSVLMLGPAALWAIEELQFGTGAHMLRPVGVYPAPVVRLALLGELVKDLGGSADVAGVAEAALWLEDLTGPARDEALAHLQVVPAVARALLDLPFAGSKLRALADSAVVAGNGRVRSWAEQLGREEPLISPNDTRLAPRLLLAAGVHRYRTTDWRVSGTVHRNLVCELADSGPDTLLAEGSDQDDIVALADRFADKVLADGGGE